MQRARIGRTRGDVDRGTASCLGVRKPEVQESGRKAAPLQPWQQVHVNMARIGADDLVRRAARIVDHVAAALIGIPPLRLSRRRRVTASQSGPPVLLQSCLKTAGVQRPDNVAANTIAVLGDEAVFGTELQVRRGVDVAEDPRVSIERSGIAATVPRCQRNGIEGLDVIGCRPPQRKRRLS